MVLSVFGGMTGYGPFNSRERGISRPLETEEESMLIKNQILELEKNKIECERRYMNAHEMKVENELLKLEIERLDYILNCQKSVFDFKLEISRPLETEGGSMLIKNQILELEKNKIECERRCTNVHKMKVENELLKLEIERLDYMLNCQKSGFDFKLETSHPLVTEEESMLIMNQMHELEKNTIECECERRYMNILKMKAENELLKLELERLDYVLTFQKSGFDSKLEISCPLETEDESMLIKYQMFELEKNNIERERRYMIVHKMKVENVFLKLANERLAYMLKRQLGGIESKL